MRKTKEIAADTLAILEQGFYMNDEGMKVGIADALAQAVNRTELFTPAALETMLQNISRANDYDTLYEVVNETTLDAARRLAALQEVNMMCLNFASARNPGGGFLSGAVAQEESITRASGLYPCLLKENAYYDFHRKLDTCLYSDHMIYSPKVPVIKTEQGSLMPAPVYTAIITSPAVNAGAITKNEPNNISSIGPAMKTRIEKMLALSLHYGHDTLVLGAWGCGVFQNSPEHIAGLFHEALTGKFGRQFKKIVFAVYASKNMFIEPFQRKFL